jgi:hypothetical protein
VAILVDLRTAGGECSEFVRACRQACAAATPPILVMAQTPRATLGAIEAGAGGYLKLPPERATMVSMMSQAHLNPSEP